MKYKEPRVGRYLIYGLLDPSELCLCYVGKTHKRREIRLNEHIENALNGSTSPVHMWIRDLIASGLVPVPEVFVIRRVTSDSSWQEAEKEEIERWRNWPALEL